MIINTDNNMIQYLENKTDLKITKLDFDFYNPHLLGYKDGKKKCFIKIFNIESNFNRELEILKLLGREIIFTDFFDNKYILAMEYYKIKEIKEYDKKFLNDIGCELAKFHNLTPPKGFYAPTLYELLDYYYNEIVDEDKEEINEIYEYFINKKEILEQEESKLTKKLLHGSFMADNAGYVGEKLILLDFESSLVQIPWFDFIVAFNSRLGLGLEIDTFLNSYTQHTNFEPISDELQALLQFIILTRLIVYTRNNRISRNYAEYLPSTKANILNRLHLHII